MMNQTPTRIAAACFSATGETRRTVMRLARQAANMAGAVFDTADFSVPAARRREFVFAPGDMIFCGAPVWYGALPPAVTEYLAAGSLRAAGQGDGKDRNIIAVPVITYGGPGPGTALKDLCGALTRAGFVVPAAALIAARNAFLPDLYPEASFDAAPFLRSLMDKYAAPNPTPVTLPASFASGAPFLPAPTGDAQRPRVDMHRCEGCCLCAGICTAEAIPRSDPTTTPGPCTRCHACIARCQRQARSFTDEGYINYVNRLRELCIGTPHESRFYI